MENLDDRTKKILNSANSRRFELEKENIHTSFVQCSPKDLCESSPRKVLSENQANPALDDIRSKFAALAAADEQFSYEPTRSKGDRSEQKLGMDQSPNVAELFKPKCHFIPLRSSNEVNIHGSTPKKVTIKEDAFKDSSIRVNITANGDPSNEITSTEFGLHTFLTKKTVQHGSASSPQKNYTNGPETPGMFSSPICFDPKATSSPINENHFVRSSSTNKGFNNSRLHGPISEISPIRSMEPTNGFANSQQRLNNSENQTPQVPYQHHGAVSSISAHLSNPSFDKPISKSEVMAEVKPRLAVYHTLWRGSAGTPVVQGADPKEPTKPPSPPNTNMKSLRSRWEFSSATGTPLHPDATEDELLKTARHMVETAISVKRPVKKLPFMTSTISHSSTTRPSKGIYTPKPPAYNDRDDDEDEEDDSSQVPILRQEHPEVGPNQEGEVIEEGDFDDSYQHETNETVDGIKAIDAAFEFINSPQKQQSCASLAQDYEKKTPSPQSNLAPLATHETSVAGSPEKPLIKQCIRTSPLAALDTLSSNAKTSESDPALTHSVSFYRKQRSAKDDKIDKIVYAGVQTPTSQQKVIQAESRKDREKRVDDAARIQQAIAVEEERVAQASRALMYCRQSGKFSGSREEVEAQRTLLIAKETRNVLIAEMERVDQLKSRNNEMPQGALQISQIKLFLSHDFLKGLDNHFRDIDIVYYFIILIKCESTLLHTALISNKDGIKGDGSIEFNQYLHIENIHPEFNCTCEVYALRSKEECISHEEKYRIKGGTLKGLQAKTSKNSSYSNPILDSGFQLVGRLILHMNSMDRRKFHLIEPQHPLLGELHMKIKKFATTKGGISHRGFLSLYQKSQGLASWTRYWCALENGEMKFWRSPEDENTKNWTVLIDLSTCTKDGAIVEPHGNFPHSFHIDVWVPKEGTSREMEKLRVLMAADHKEMLIEWIDVLNKTIRNLLIWSTSTNS